MKKVLEICMSALSRERLLSAVMGSAATAVLATVNVKAALFTSAAVLVMLTLAAAAAAPLYKITAKAGVEAVYFTLCAAVAMCAATVYTHFDIIASDSIAKIMALTAASGLVLSRVPKSDEHVAEAVLDSAVTGALFAAVAVSVAAMRELLAFGTLMGHTVAHVSLPIAAKPAFGLMMLGAYAALINVICVIVRALRMKKIKREEEVTVIDE